MGAPVGVVDRRMVSIAAADGRPLEVELAGPPDGVPLIFHHGTPGAALEREADAVSGISADELLRVWQELFCPADRSAVTGAYAEHTRVPGARARLCADEGHLSLTLSSYGEILDALLEG